MNTSEKKKEEEEGEACCFLCGPETSGLRLEQCADCQLVWSCPDHARFHSGSGSGGCFPFRVSVREGRGKCLVATRDIHPGELILRDKPIVESPYTRTRPQCLQCARRVDGSYRCRKCGFPMCDRTCANGELHRIECSVLEEENFEAEIDNFDEWDDHYACVMPLRCLALQSSDPVAWRLFSGFQSHTDLQRKHHGRMWDFHQEHSVDFLREVLELGERWSSEEIRTVIYTMYTNSVNMDLGPGRGSLTGFYPGVKEVQVAHRFSFQD